MWRCDHYHLMNMYGTTNKNYSMKYYSLSVEVNVLLLTVRQSMEPPSDAVMSRSFYRHFVWCKLINLHDYTSYDCFYW